MQIGHRLQFNCLSCDQSISFSVLEPDAIADSITCSNCKKKYLFDDNTLAKQLRQFEALCSQIHASKEILGNTLVAVNVGPHQVKIPYKILLTRLSSLLELKIGDQNFNINFRLEPIKDVPEVLLPKTAPSLS